MKAGEIYTVFDEGTRLPVGILTCTQDQLAKNLKAGQIAVPGRFPGTRLGDDGEPIEDPERADRLQADRLRETAQTRIEELERRALRALIEHALGDQSAVARLQAISEEIVQRRGQR